MNEIIQQSLDLLHRGITVRWLSSRISQAAQLLLKGIDVILEGLDHLLIEVDFGTEFGEHLLGGLMLSIKFLDFLGFN